MTGLHGVGLKLPAPHEAGAFSREVGGSAIRTPLPGTRGVSPKTQLEPPAGEPLPPRASDPHEPRLPLPDRPARRWRSPGNRPGLPVPAAGHLLSREENAGPSEPPVSPRVCNHRWEESCAELFPRRSASWTHTQPGPGCPHTPALYLHPVHLPALTIGALSAPLPPDSAQKG